MSFSTKKNVLITGATSGIGKSIALTFAELGFNVGVLGRNLAAAESVAAEVDSLGGKGLVLTADVSSSSDLSKAVDRFVTEYGSIDIVVANAGIEVMGTVIDTDESDWDKLLNINLKGAFLTAKYTVPYLLESKGSFTAIGSDASTGGACGFAAYCAAKHGLVGLIRCMALDHGPVGVRSNIVCPGFVETPMADRLLNGLSQAEVDHFKKMVPLGRFAKPQDVANVVAHLSSDEASYVNGVVYSLDGGSTAGYFAG